MAIDPVAEKEQLGAVRVRIGEIYDELAGLPREALAQRSALGAERDTLTGQLRAAEANAATTNEWAERSARGPAETERPHIPSHSEGGGGSFG